MIINYIPLAFAKNIIIIEKLNKSLHAEHKKTLANIHDKKYLYNLEVDNILNNAYM